MIGDVPHRKELSILTISIWRGWNGSGVLRWGFKLGKSSLKPPVPLAIYTEATLQFMVDIHLAAGLTGLTVIN